MILVALGAMVVYALSGRDVEQIQSAPIIVLANSVSFFMVLLLGTWLARVSPRRLYPFRRFDPRLLLPLVAVGLAMVPLLGQLDSLFRLIPAPDWFVAYRDEVDVAVLQMIRGSFWYAAVALMVVAPLTEELFFRGLLLHGFLGRYGCAKAVWASALIFALAHLTPNQILPAVLLGLVMGWLMAETRNLWLPIIVHVTANSVSVFAVGLGFEDIGPAEPTVAESLVVAAVCLAVTGAGLLALRRMLRSRPPAV